MDKIIVIGTSGLARELSSWVKEFFEIVGYSSLNAAEHSQFNMPGKFYSDTITPKDVGTDLAVVAIGDPAIKESVYNKLHSVGFRFPTIVHKSSVVLPQSKLEEGVVVSPQCVISTNVEIGRLAFINFSSIIGHETLIGQFTQINTGVQIGGSSKIGEKVLIGSNATILQGRRIGNNATIGIGSVVLSNVSRDITVFGNPAKFLCSKEK